MKYKVINTCHGFLGRMFLKGEIVELDPATNPPRHLVPLEDVVPDAPKPAPHRTEPVELAPGQQRKVEGGLADNQAVNSIGRMANMTTDKVPNIAQEKAVVKTPRKRRPANRATTSKKKDAGSVKR